ncbi:hypothetical protein F2P45_13090 [Massilia sp. CCM 8733]|uniref:Meckel syndrome type 1 protein n=1 Tax=Massilia mucilaginosa TaxID=2609282 RepID=A0ABX0NTC1_9BURK|nr:hypothetical protein [Massilia mucilaginosa]NHZ89940.1 hypothetical protein [Massilia mucilaginosa]
MTKISAFIAVADDKSAATRQADAANQRESWLRQMELAQLAGMGKAGAARDRSDAKLAAAAPAALRPMPQAERAVQRAEERARDAAPDERTNDAGQQGGDSVRAAADRAPDAAPQAPAHATAAAHAPPATQQDAQACVAQAASVITPGPAARTLQAAAILSAPATANAPAPGAPGTGMALAAAAAAGGRAGALQLARENTAPALPPVAVREPVRLSAALAARTEDGDAHEAAPARQAADTDAELGDKPVWEKRLMHLTGNGKDVDLWIRDGELDPAQSMSLLYRLAGDMASAGLRLKGATINGKPLLRAGAALAAGARPDFAQALDTDEAAAHDSAAPITPTGNHHGNR